jgi:hypothetical protein
VHEAAEEHLPALVGHQSAGSEPMRCSTRKVTNMAQFARSGLSW